MNAIDHRTVRAELAAEWVAVAGAAAVRDQRADRYSRAVTVLKRLLPIIGAALLLLVAAWPRLAPLLDSVRWIAAGIDLREARELKMLNPRYAGTDRLNRPYVITAAVGRQLPNRSDLMSLEQPKAVMIVHGGASVVVTAATAVYQSQPQLLDLFDNVTLTHQNGTRFVTQRAHANLANDTAEGQVPIEGHGPSGDVWGQGFRVLDRGDTIIFTGNSRAILRGTKPAKPASPPEPPARILAAAALVEAAANSATATAAPAATASTAAPVRTTTPEAVSASAAPHMAAPAANRSAPVLRRRIAARRHLSRHAAKTTVSTGLPIGRAVPDADD